LLLVALFPAASGSIESDSNREAFHHFTFGADLVLFACMIAYVQRAAAASRAEQSAASKWGPLVVLTLGCCLLILDPIRHVLLDHGGVFFKEQTLAMYSVLGGLSPMGKACQIASISGMILMVSGVLWHMRMPEALLRNLSTSESSKVQ